jgi:hypothetical protein
MLGMNHEEALEIVWKVIDDYVDTNLGNRIGRGECTENDSEYEEQYDEICEAMDHLKSICEEWVDQ